MRAKQGITLIEVVIYIGLLALILPVLLVFIVNTSQRQAHISQRIHVANNATVLMQDLRDDLRHATEIHSTSSTFSVIDSELVFTDQDGSIITIDLENDSYSVEGVNRTIGRLQRTVLAESSWLTSNDLTVTEFQVDPVRNADTELVGLNVRFIVEPHIVVTESQQSNVMELETTIWLNEYVTES